MTTMIEKMARAMAHSDYQARLKVIEESQSTDRPISVPGPFDGLDYLLSESRWDQGGAGFIKESYRRLARAALEAIREPDQAALGEVYNDPDGPEARDLSRDFTVIIDAILSEK
jgi:hypothetical protein